MSYPYDPFRTSLIYPARDAIFFPQGRPVSEASLCAELSRLVYAPFERATEAAELVHATLSRIGFARCRFFSSLSTAAFLAQSPGHLILVFRGTEPDPRDWATDLDAVLIPCPGGGRVHRGFAEALESVWEPISQALEGSGARLLFTGHSLGAALATLAALRRAPDSLLTFGSPRVGDADLVQRSTGMEHLRFLNCCDIVGRVPPAALGYAHAGSLRYIDREGVVHPEPVPELVAADQEQARQDYLQLWAWRQGTLWTRDAADHAPVNYVAALRESESAAPD